MFIIITHAVKTNDCMPNFYLIPKYVNITGGTSNFVLNCILTFMCGFLKLNHVEENKKSTLFEINTNCAVPVCE